MENETLAVTFVFDMAVGVLLPAIFMVVFLIIFQLIRRLLGGQHHRRNETLVRPVQLVDKQPIDKDWLLTFMTGGGIRETHRVTPRDCRQVEAGVSGKLTTQGGRFHSFSPNKPQKRKSKT